MVLADGGPAARRPRGVFYRASGCSVSFGLPKKVAEERMIKLVSPSSGSDQQTFLHQACEIFGLESASEVLGCQFACAQIGEFVHQFKFPAAELGHIGSEFFASQLIEYLRPGWFELQRLNLDGRSGQVLANERKEIRVSQGLFL